MFQAEVNAIKWDLSGSLLASCSDDATAKVDRSACSYFGPSENLFFSQPEKCGIDKFDLELIRLEVCNLDSFL